MKQNTSLFRLVFFSFTILVFVACTSPTGEEKKEKLTEAKWLEILNDIAAKGVIVDLDLSSYLRSGESTGGGLRSDGTFDPMNNSLGSTERTGMSKIGSLILPDAATTVLKGFVQSFNLKSVKGINITHLGEYAFGNNMPNPEQVILENIDFPNLKNIGSGAFMNAKLIKANFPSVNVIEDQVFNGCVILESAYFPEVVTIGFMAFMDCPALETVYIPKIVELGKTVFGYGFTSNGGPITITMGSMPPKLGTTMFGGTLAAIPVIINVPTSATGYGPSVSGGSSSILPAETWGNGLRGFGWNGSNFVEANTALYNPNISVTINYN